MDGDEREEHPHHLSLWQPIRKGRSVAEEKRNRGSQCQGRNGRLAKGGTSHQEGAIGMSKRITAVTILTTIALALLAGCSSSGSDLQTVSPGEASAIIDSETEPVVLDIRTPDEYQTGIIEGAVNIDFYENDFAIQLDALDKEATYVVYCRSGNRSGQSMTLLEKLGFVNVTEVQGGILAWEADGLPVVAP